MNIILVLISVVFLLTIPNATSAKELYFICDDIHPEKWKYSVNWLGMGKIYYEKKDEWKQSDDVDISDDKLIIKGWHYKGDCKPSCDFKFVISLLAETRNKHKITTIKEIITSEKCEKGWSVGNCYTKREGDIIKSEMCRIVKPVE